jgi:hypothetical protein
VTAALREVCERGHRFCIKRLILHNGRTCELCVEHGRWYRVSEVARDRLGIGKEKGALLRNEVGFRRYGFHPPEGHKRDGRERSSHYW